MHYVLECLGTGEELTDDLLPLKNPKLDRPALLRTRYTARTFAPRSIEEGIYRFRDWLPIRHTLRGSSSPVTYRSEGLARHLGLDHLFITFSGYWPERRARMYTGTFKECEAFSVCARLPEDHKDVLVVASAGNTARAFIRVCSENRIPLVVVAPERNLPALWTTSPVENCVHLVVAAGDSDYTDAIVLSEIIASLPGFTAEGGARNVARRDGMGTTMLSAVEAMGAIPAHYFQAIGSGTGAIAAWEANLRLLATGEYGHRKVRLHLSQNAPFTPIHDSWRRKSPYLLAMDDAEARVRIATIGAKVLANRTPPYGISGGLYDALVDTDGTTAAIDNDTADKAAKLFESLEGIDPEPAAAVAIAHLMQAVHSGLVQRNEQIMLNVTGGGYARIREDLAPQPIRPSRVIGRERFSTDEVATAIESLVSDRVPSVAVLA